ncbi:hypothetical protein SETIT_1G258400v2 [Setaria italica]|uniref:DUF4408 domain-containing protein n=1 Tax=Setaria italica TaxID=4555 RepID=K3YUD7_SETIT|nr:uncharacterized protein LOC101782186 [Setaria italica]RCV07607.1 hypothetical protein SETIT_1G258400v2 [Setaria italica]
MAGVAAPAPTQQTSHVSRAIPLGLVPVAVLLAAAVGLLALLPSLAQAVWEVPQLFLLGLVISYGVFAQRNADADGNAAKERSLAWNSRYHPDGPLVVVADHAAAPSDDDEDGQHGARERPLSLPVRRLKSAAAQESETGGDAGDAFGEETDSCASSSGFWAGARAVPSPPSVLDADLGLSPCSQPESSRPFFVHGANKSHGFDAATLSTMSRVPHDQPWSDDGEGTDWEEDAEGSDEMTTSSERSVRGDLAAAACVYDHSEGDGDGDTSVDEELLELAAKAEPDGEEEVDRKADEFIAKFREQIRLQRH